MSPYFKSLGQSPRTVAQELGLSRGKPKPNDRDSKARNWLIQSTFLTATDTLEEAESRNPTLPTVLAYLKD